jgi:hypothetical protein
VIIQSRLPVGTRFKRVIVFITLMLGKFFKFSYFNQSSIKYLQTVEADSLFLIFNQNEITLSINVIYIFCDHNKNKLLSRLDYGECVGQLKFPKMP